MPSRRVERKTQKLRRYGNTRIKNVTYNVMVAVQVPIDFRLVTEFNSEGVRKDIYQWRNEWARAPVNFSELVSRLRFIAYSRKGIGEALVEVYGLNYKQRGWNVHL